MQVSGSQLQVKGGTVVIYVSAVSQRPQKETTEGISEPAPVAQLDAPSDWRPGGRGFNPRWGRQHSFVEIDHEIFSTFILSLPLIQEGQLSVSGERMCTILVNHLEDYACPVNVWLGKLTTLDMTPLGWLGCKTSTQTNKLKEYLLHNIYYLHVL